jgi:hypothetical protein
MTRSLVLILVAAALLVTGGSALAAPPQLYNKTITVSSTISVNAVADDGSSVNRPRTVQRTIYISSKGRLFVRVERQSGTRSTTAERSPEETSKAFSFQGSKLVGVLKFPSGAAQMVISFDSGFSSCSTSVLFGKEGGQNIRFKGLDGKMYTQQGGFNVSNQTCSIREGNPFAG